jgi:hypothetical protein
MTISHDQWRGFLDRIVKHPNISQSAALCGFTDQSFFNAIRQSGKEEYRDRLFFEWQGEARWIADHYGEARKQNIVLLEAHLRDLLQRDEEIVIEGGKIQYQMDPRWIGESDEWMTDFGLDPVRDRYLRDKDGMPIPLTVKKLAIPAHLLIRGAAAMLPRMWGERSEVNVNIGGGVMVIGGKKKTQQSMPNPKQIEGRKMETRSPTGYLPDDPPEIGSGEEPVPRGRQNPHPEPSPPPARPKPDIWKEPDPRTGYRSA